MISSIDDLLMSGKQESQPDIKEPEYTEPEDGDSVIGEDSPYEESEQESSDYHEEEQEESSSKEYDEYGNENSSDEDKPVYSKKDLNERINKAMRQRLNRGESEDRIHQKQEIAKDFQYNENSDDSWQQQLESFVENAVVKMNQKQEQVQRDNKEKQIREDLQKKFVADMSKFNDFEDVVGYQSITPAMSYALRAIDKPASFIYAASKNYSAELDRISRLPDEYAQIVEMGKLEERMKKTKQSTQAPKPISRTKEESAPPPKKQKRDTSFDDLLAKEDAKRKEQIRNRRGR